MRASSDAERRQRVHSITIRLLDHFFSACVLAKFFTSDFSPQYLGAAVRYPESKRLGFIHMGLGIERRSRVYRDSWKAHLETSRRVQEEWLNSGAELKERAAVLGAGRLFDFAAERFGELFREIHFLDADPLSIETWKRFGRSRVSEVHPHILEATGRLWPWARALERDIRTLDFDESVKKLASYATGALLTPHPLEVFFERVRPTHVLSLNLLSQLPVMWQNTVERILVSRFGRALTAERESDWRAGYAASGRLLIREHLEALGNSGAGEILIVTDVEYFSYPLQGTEIDPEKFRWAESESGVPWSYLDSERSEDVLARCENYDALLGVNVENDRLLSVLFPSYEPKVGETWFWQIVPRAEVANGPGTLHRVRSIRLTRKGDMPEKERTRE